VINLDGKIYRDLSNSVLALILASLLLAPTASCEEAANGDSAAAATETGGIKPVAKLTGVYADRGIDIDGDGLFDLLVVEAEIEVAALGEYSLMGFLHTIDHDEITWSIDHGVFEPGRHKMLLEFDGGTIAESGTPGPLRLVNVVLSSGNSESGQVISDYVAQAYRTNTYNFSDFRYPAPSEKTISGSGDGELLVTFTVKAQAPVSSGRYSLDIVDIKIPPISTPMTVRGSKTGYSFDLPGIFMPNKPNNFTVTAKGVENLNVGLKKPQGEKIRTWVSTQVLAGDDGTATAETDLISPGSYHVKIFGTAADNVTIVDLTMTMEKKLIIDGKFILAIDTAGFPSGDYSVEAKAVNGSFGLDEIGIGGLSIGEGK